MPLVSGDISFMLFQLINNYEFVIKDDRLDIWLNIQLISRVAMSLLFEIIS